MKTRKCRWCDEMFPVEFDRPLMLHNQGAHPAQYRVMAKGLRDVDEKLLSLEITARTISRGWDVEEPVDRWARRQLQEKDAYQLFEEVADVG